MSSESPIEFVKQVGSISEYRLKSNGLSILLYPKETGVPVVTFNVTYRVGSRNESTGNTGSTHFLEHVGFYEVCVCNMCI